MVVNHQSGVISHVAAFLPRGREDKRGGGRHERQRTHRVHFLCVRFTLFKILPTPGRRNHTPGCMFILFGDHPLSRGEVLIPNPDSPEIPLPFLIRQLSETQNPSREHDSQVPAPLEFMSTRLRGSHWEAEWLCPIFWALQSRKCCLQGTESNVGDRDPL